MLLLIYVDNHIVAVFFLTHYYKRYSHSDCYCNIDTHLLELAATEYFVLFNASHRLLLITICVTFAIFIYHCSVFFFLVIALLFKSYRAIRKIFYRAATSKNCNDYKQRQLLQQQLIVATNAGSANNMGGRMSERWR